MKKISLYIFALSTLIASKALAQTEVTSISYSMGFTTGDYNKFMSTTSFRGATLDWRHLVTENVGVGLELGWNAFYEDRGYTTIEKDNLALSGNQFRYSSSVPILVSANYYLKPVTERVSPYVSFGIGTQYTRDNTDMGIYTLEDDCWHFMLKPELGVLISPQENFGIMVAAKYYNGFKTSETDSRNYFTVNVGFVWH